MIRTAQQMPQKYQAQVHALARMAPEPMDDAELLITAARSNDASQIRMLLEGGATVDAQDKQGWTALHWAINKRHAAAATVLVQAGADSEVEARDGWTPMALAVKGGSPTIIEVAMKGLDRKMVRQ